MRSFNAVESNASIGRKAERWMTADAWQAEDCYIRKGERSKLRSPQGLPLFNEHQVVEQPDIIDDRPGF